MSTDLEQLVRDVLEARAGTVTSGPQWDLAAVRPRRRRAWVAALSAAAAVVAVAAAAALVSVHHDATTPPQTAPPSTHFTPPTTHSAPPPTGGLHAATCTAPLPAAWPRAISAGTVPAAAGRLTPLAMTPGGDVVARRASGGHDQVVLVHPDRSVSVLYTPPDGLGVAAAAADQDWVMLARTAEGGDPYGIEAVRISDGTTVEVRSPSVRTDAIVQTPVLHEHTVYWTEGNQFGQATVYAFDLPARTTRTLDHGYLSPTVDYGGGVYWLKSASDGTKSGRLITEVAGTLPPHFVVQPWSDYNELVQDGNDFAWGNYVGSGPRYVFRAWTPGADPVLVFASSSAGAGEIPTLSMPYLFARSRVVDLHTGASAPLPADVQFAANGVLAVDTGTGLSIVRTADLPEPRC